MVAAAGETTGLAPRVAVACLAAVILGTALFTYVRIKENALERLHPNKPPEVLSHKAREIIAKLGYSEPPGDKVGGFSYDDDFLDDLGKIDKPHPVWNQVLTERPQLLQFRYRQSPDDMAASGFGVCSLRVWSRSTTRRRFSPA